MERKKYNIFDIDSKSYTLDKENIESIAKLMVLIRDKKYKEAEIFIKELSAYFENLKQEAIKQEDEEHANKFFLLKRLISGLNYFLSFWKHAEQKDFPEAWRQLQNAIITFEIINKFHEGNYERLFDEFESYFENFEKLFPYNYFSSIEFLAKKRTCSICGKSTSDVSCNHIVGDLYFGKIACNIIEEVEFLGVAMVKNPIDKKCTFDIKYDKEKIEESAFRLIDYGIGILKNPFHLFRIETTERLLPREHYNDYSLESLCPCGSEKIFKNCCSSKEEISNPNYNIVSRGIISFKSKLADPQSPSSSQSLLDSESSPSGE